MSSSYFGGPQPNEGRDQLGDVLRRAFPLGGGSFAALPHALREDEGPRRAEAPLPERPL